MRKLYLPSVALLSFSISSVFAQQNINLLIPKIGDSVVVASVTLTASQVANPGTSGTMKSWDFTEFSPGTTYSTSKYVSPNGMPGASFFPTATLATVSSSLITGKPSSVGFLSTSSTGVNTIGLYNTFPGGSVVQQFSDPILQDFPNLAYNGTFTDAIAGTQIIDPDFPLYDIIGIAKYKYDAHGSLKYALGNFSNVARLNYTSDMTFDGVGIYVGQKVVSESQNYAYYDLTSKQLLLTIVTSTTKTSFEGTEMGSTTLKRVLIYKPNGVTGLENEINSGASNILYPNPAVDKITVNEAFSSIAIKNNNGTTIFTKNIEPGLEVNISLIDNGVYYAEMLTARGERKFVKLVVNK